MFMVSYEVCALVIIFIMGLAAIDKMNDRKLKRR